jgi:hypothetical protein
VATVEARGPARILGPHASLRIKPKAKPSKVALWQERQRPNWAGGPPQPPFDLAPVARKSGAKDVAVLGEPPSVSAAVDHEEPSGDDLRQPPAIGRNPTAQPQLAIEGAEGFRDVDELGFELDDEQRPRSGVPSEGVDHAPLAVDGEGHLGRDLPGTDIGEPASESLMQRGVTGTDDAIELAPAPAQRVVRPAVERLGCGSDGLHGQLIGKPALHPGHV